MAEERTSAVTVGYYDYTAQQCVGGEATEDIFADRTEVSDPNRPAAEQNKGWVSAQRLKVISGGSTPPNAGRWGEVDKEEAVREEYVEEPKKPERFVGLSDDGLTRVIVDYPQGRGNCEPTISIYQRTKNAADDGLRAMSYGEINDPDAEGWVRGGEILDVKRIEDGNGAFHVEIKVKACIRPYTEYNDGRIVAMPTTGPISFYTVKTIRMSEVTF